MNAAFPQGWQSEISEKQLSYHQLPLSNKPFEIKLKNGVVDDLIVSQGVPTWEVNILKGIASQLQADTQGKNLIKSRSNQLPKKNSVNAVYRTMEESVTGECEVLYDISPLPNYVLQSRPQLAPFANLRGEGQILDIVKTTNFSNCDQRIGYHFGLTGITDWEAGSNQMGDFLAVSFHK